MLLYLSSDTTETEYEITEMSSWGQANRGEKLGLVWRNRKKFSQIINDYFCLPFFLLIILCCIIKSYHIVVALPPSPPPSSTLHSVFMIMEHGRQSAKKIDSVSQLKVWPRREHGCSLHQTEATHLSQL
jgi:hypothetical protein